MTDWNALFADALIIAADAHRDQKREDGSPYIYHPLRVMANCDSIQGKIVALLHDVVEDSESHTIETLKEAGFPQQIVEAVEALTKNPKDDYWNYLDRVCGTALSAYVKIRDLEDNMNIVGVRLTGYACDRLRKYKKARELILNRWQAIRAWDSLSSEGADV